MFVRGSTTLLVRWSVDSTDYCMHTGTTDEASGMT